MFVFEGRHRPLAAAASSITIQIRHAQEKLITGSLSLSYYECTVIFSKYVADPKVTLRSTTKINR